MGDARRAARPFAVAVGGAAGAGKSTLGRALARSLSLPLLDLDSLTNPLLDRIDEPTPGRHWLSGPGAAAVREGRYAALREVATEVVDTAGGVVLVAPFTAELQDGPEWEVLRQAVAPADLRMVHVSASPELRSRRLAQRGSDRDRHRPRDEVDAGPRIPVIPVDADLDTAQQLVRVRVALGARTPLDEGNRLFGERFEAVLFDLDGSLVDSTASVVRSWRLFAADTGISMQALHDNHGQPARTLMEKLLPQGDIEAGVARITEIEVGDAPGLRPVVGAAALFGSVPPARRAIVTSGSLPIASARLAAAGIPPPAVLVTSDDVRRGKPHPEPFLLAAQRLGVRPERCLVVEDAGAGIRSARAAGCDVLAVMGTVGLPDLADASLVVDALDRVAVTRAADGLLRLRPGSA